MKELRKYVIPEIVFGEGAAKICNRYALNFGSTRPLIVTDEGIVSTGLVDTICDQLKETGLSPVVFSNVCPNPRDSQVTEGAKTYLSQQCDLIIGLGGGSPMDCAKAIGLLATNGGTVQQFEGIDNVENPAPPLICIPTTAGTSADVSQFSIISDTKRKLKFAIISKTTVPDVALIDPVTTYTMDPYLTACTGVDALVHAIEAYVSTAASPMTDLHALEAIKIISSNLVTSVHNPLSQTARTAMMYASMQAGIAFSNASLGIVHAMAHALGGLLDLPHGECNALLLKSAIEANFSSAEDKYTTIAHTLGIPKEETHNLQAKPALLNWLTRLFEQINISEGLKSRGVSLKLIPSLAQNAILDPCAVTNPAPLDLLKVQKLYERAL